MSLGVPGGSAIVNFLMKWPVLIPIATVLGATVLINRPVAPPLEQLPPTTKVQPPKAPTLKPPPAPPKDKKG